MPGPSCVWVIHLQTGTMAMPINYLALHWASGLSKLITHKLCQGLHVHVPEGWCPLAFEHVAACSVMMCFTFWVNIRSSSRTLHSQTPLLKLIVSVVQEGLIVIMSVQQHDEVVVILERIVVQLKVSEQLQCPG